MADPIPPSSSSTPVWTEYDAVLFDLDGVITPTAEVHQKAWREVFEEVLPIVATGEEQIYRPDDYALHIDGRSRYEGVEALLAAHGVSVPWGSPVDPPGLETICAIGNRKNAVFNAILEREPVVPFPGSVALMEHLRSVDVAFALVSSSKNARAVLVAADLVDEFDVVIDGRVIADRELAGKPQPDPFLEAARQLDARPERCVVVEDAISGVQAGRAGGFGLVVGVARENDPGLLAEAGADLVVTDLGELV